MKIEAKGLPELGDRTLSAWLDDENDSIVFELRVDDKFTSVKLDQAEAMAFARMVMEIARHG